MSYLKSILVGVGLGVKKGLRPESVGPRAYLEAKYLNTGFIY